MFNRWTTLEFESPSTNLSTVGISKVHAALWVCKNGVGCRSKNAASTPQLNNSSMTTMIELFRQWCVDIQNIQISKYRYNGTALSIWPKHAKHNEKKDCKQHHILFASMVHFQTVCFNLSQVPWIFSLFIQLYSLHKVSALYQWVGSNEKLPEARGFYHVSTCFQSFRPGSDRMMVWKRLRIPGLDSPLDCRFWIVVLRCFEYPLVN